MTNKLGTLTNLTTIQFINCSLTYLPDLSNLQKLELLDAPHNNLSRIDGLPGVKILSLDINSLTEIPVTNNPENLEFLGISYNPLESASPITSYKNLEMLYMQFTTLTKIPRDIDRLQKLEVLHIAGNNLTHLPTNLLNLPQLEFLNATKNLLSFDEIVGIKKLFKKSHPKTELFI
jgi:Leucine-rich repeat (LRR) protein